MFALSAVVPLCAMALSESDKVRIAVGVLFAVPAVVSVIPSRFTYALRPQPYEQSESWYSSDKELFCGFGASGSDGTCRCPLAGHCLTDESPSR